MYKIVLPLLVGYLTTSFAYGDEPDPIAIKVGDRIVVELFGDASLKYVAQIGNKIQSRHVYAPVVCTIEAIHDDGTLKLFGFQYAEKVSFGDDGGIIREPRLLTVRLSVASSKLKTEFAVEARPNFQYPSAPKDTPSVLFANAERLTVESWKNVAALSPRENRP